MLFGGYRHPQFMRYLSLGFFLVVACTSNRSDTASPESAGDRAAIARTWDRYMVHARAVNADSVATFYTSNATLFEPGIFPIVTRDSIRAFMGSFPGVRVDSATAPADTIEVYGNTAYLWGSYFEKLAFPGQPESQQHGRFVIQWVKQPDGAWLIHRFYRVPEPPRSPGPAAK